MYKKENGKTERIYFRVSKEEKSILSKRAKSAKLSLSKYILALSEKKKIIDPEPIVRLIIEMNRIGNNINQIAKVANTNKTISQNQIDILQKQMEYLKRKTDLALSMTLEKEKDIIPPSPDTIRYQLDEIKDLLYKACEAIHKND